MNRRSFLTRLATVATVALVDPERLLWTPGQTTHVLPPARGWRPGDGSLFNPRVNLARQFREGILSRELGFEWYGPPIDVSAWAKAMADRVDAEAYELAYAANVAFYRGDQWPSRYRGVFEMQRRYNAMRSAELDRLIVTRTG